MQLLSPELTFNVNITVCEDCQLIFWGCRLLLILNNINKKPFLKFQGECISGGGDGGGRNQFLFKNQKSHSVSNPEVQVSTDNICSDHC